jgi:hypothetical protein
VVFALAVAVLVLYLAVARPDIQRPSAEPGRSRRLRTVETSVEVEQAT